MPPPFQSASGLNHRAPLTSGQHFSLAYTESLQLHHHVVH